jgi:signal transduction histidine kinase
MSPHGMGLLGMRERVEARGGQLSVRLQPGTGLLLEAWMPIEAWRPEHVDG